MSKKAKLLAKLMSGKQDRSFTFAEAEAVLLEAGFTLDRVTGSHHIYGHEDGRTMVLPFHGKDVKPVYIRKIRELLS